MAYIGFEAGILEDDVSNCPVTSGTIGSCVASTLVLLKKYQPK